RYAPTSDVFPYTTLFRSVTEGGEPFLVMELLEGESLARKLKKGKVSAQEGLRLMDELLDVLRAAHAEGVIHRDIKPSNLFVEPRSEEHTSELQSRENLVC